MLKPPCLWYFVTAARADGYKQEELKDDGEPGVGRTVGNTFVDSMASSVNWENSLPEERLLNEVIISKEKPSSNWSVEVGKCCGEG